MPGAAMVFHASGLNNLEEPAEIGLRWSKTGRATPDRSSAAR